ncbi:MAG: helix-turn-helix domain-containing protein [Lachnospiraceae bacterium]|nr:helix-turn-helix domain-containing protein [Lachnospiraceae bacterium]
MKLGEKIMYSRKRAGMSQIDLADALGVSRQSVSRWETGETNPEIGKLPQLAEVLHVTTDWLLSDAAPEEGFYNAAGFSESKARSSAPASSPETKTYPDWLDHLPGFILKAVKKYGWIYGLFIAAGGALFIGFGILIRVMAKNFIMSSMPGMYEQGFNTIRQSPLSGFWTISGFVMIIGALILIFGIVLALTLRKWGRKEA